jgi:DNA repair protein RadC
MSITDRWVRDRPQERVVADGRAAPPDAELLTIFPRTLAARLQAAM